MFYILVQFLQLLKHAIYKIPSMAISMQVKKNIENYEMAAKYAGEILLKAKENNIKNDIVLNVNVPLLKENEIKGIKVCKIGSRLYNNCLYRNYRRK